MGPRVSLVITRVGVPALTDACIHLRTDLGPFARQRVTGSGREPANLLLLRRDKLEVVARVTTPQWNNAAGAQWEQRLPDDILPTARGGCREIPLGDRLRRAAVRCRDCGWRGTNRRSVEHG